MRVDAEIEADVDDLLTQLDAKRLVKEAAYAARDYAHELYDDLGTRIFSQSSRQPIPEWDITTRRVGDYTYEFVFRTDHLVWRVLDFGRMPFVSHGDTFVPTHQTATTPFSFETQRAVRWGLVYVEEDVVYGYIPGRGFSLMIGQKTQKEFKKLGLQVSIKLGGPIK